MTEVVVFGDSNTAALVGIEDAEIDRPHTQGGAFHCLAVSGRAFERPFHRETGSDIRLLIPDDMKHVRIPDGFDLPDLTGDRVFVFTFGVFPVRLFSSPAWRHHAPWKVAGTEAPVSDGLLREAIIADAQPALTFFQDAAKGSLRTCVVAAPPPRRDHPILSRAGVRPEVVMAVDAAYRAEIVNRLRALDIEVVSAPATTLDTDGFLRHDLVSSRAGDTHHANRAFGRIMTDEIDRVLRRRFGVALLADSRDGAAPLGPVVKATA